MTTQYQDHLKLLQNAENQHALRSICHGIERETLRITTEARLSQKAHPETLGKALTHPYITTDYSEALLEFITPVHCRIEDTLSFLEELHQFTCQQDSDELLWAGSMPPLLEGDENIPIAQYGHSNIGRMKSVYREGLAHRYGKAMQTIAGIHYNFSLPDEFWTLLQKDGEQNEQAFRSEGYLALIRNFRRYSWLLMYLFGASPATSRSFFPDPENDYGLESFGSDTLISPYGTSLRMSDFGYTNNAQSSLSICYNTLDEYVDSLTKAIHTPYQPYEDIGLKKDGKYLQLNTNLLQIENEYYSTIRPKRVSRSGEKPITALRNHGVEYIEVRCLDINPFKPLGLSHADAHFQDVFLLYCALHNNAELGHSECCESGDNFHKVVSEGRRPGLTLSRLGQDISLKSWGSMLLEEMLPVAKLLDEANDSELFTQSLKVQQAKLDDISLTPSAQVLAAMKELQFGHLELMQLLSAQHSEHFRKQALESERLSYLKQVAERSRTDQHLKESSETKSFEAFLTDYFASN